MEEMEGIVLKNISYKENSIILYLYTQDGKISLLAKGAKKIKNSKLSISQSITKIRFNASNSDLHVLYNAEIINNYANIKKDILKITYVNHIFELIYSNLADDFNHMKLYSFLSRLLDKIESGFDTEIMSFIFELKFLYLLGVGPYFKGCTNCGAKDNLMFDIAAGGFKCDKCIDNSPKYTDYLVLDTIIKLYNINIDELSLIELNTSQRKEIRRFIDEYYGYHSGYVTKSKKLLSDLIGY